MRRILGLISVSVVGAVTPVQKVIQMLNDMSAQGKKEKHEESVRFSKFNQWCKDVSAEKTNNIENAEAEIGQLTAFIAKAEADADALGRSIADLEDQLGQFKADAAEATSVREKEHKDFVDVKTDYEESIDALQRAQNVLNQQSYDRKQAKAALIQISTLSKISAQEKRRLSSLLTSGEDPDFLARQNPEANAYEFQSGGAVAMLETLESKFVDELRAAEKDEANTKHAYTLIMQSLTDQIGHAEDNRDEQTAQRHGKKEAAGKAKADLTDAQASHAADTKYLSDLTAECSVKSREFASRQKLRGEELEAIAQAVDIISSKAVTGNSEKHLPQLLQKGLSFVQLKTESVFSDNRQKLIEFLRARARKEGSQKLSLLAAEVANNPFGKVTRMIESLIMKLKEEANAEAEQHGWCQTELATNKQTREDKSASADKLNAEIDSLNAEIAEQTQKMKELTEAVRASDAAVAEARAQRSEESKKNKIAVADAKVAQEAVQQALTVLKEFYGKAAEATAFAQGAADDAPETFSKSYKGMQGESGGVVGMLEVIQSDFVRLETETSAEEAESEAQHGQFLDDSAEDKAVKEAEHNHLNKRRTRNETNLNAAKRELAAVSEELQAANDYYETLKPTCVGGKGNYAERKAAREAEIQSLKEALEIFESH